MKIITLSVEAEVLQIVRRHAAERHSSVSALIRDFLRRLAEREDRGRQARRRIREMIRKGEASIGSRGRTRDELHQR